MARRDKVLGEWKATFIIPNKLVIKRYEFGLFFKYNGRNTKRIKYGRKTIKEDMSNALNEYFDNLKKNQDVIKK